MEAFFVSLSAVAVAEVGDRTQLLSLMLVCCYRRPWIILAGIIGATAVNHLLAGVVGILLASWLTPRLLDGIVAVSLMGMAGWTLVPDKEGAQPDCSSRNVFFTTITMFFLAEIGDKTQIATTALAAAYHNLWLVVAGSTLGLLAANAPVLFLGNAFASRLPLKTIRIVAACLFALLAVLFAVRAITG